MRLIGPAEAEMSEVEIFTKAFGLAKSLRKAKAAIFDRFALFG